MRRRRWLLSRRLAQALVLAAFASGPWWGLPVAEGTLAASRWFGRLTLVDPLAAAQAAVAGHALAWPGIAGAVLVALGLVLFSGRSFCAWVCPVNLVTDGAEALRRIIGLGGWAWLRADRRLRHGVALLALAASAATGTVAWEAVNPITMTMRGLVFGAWGAAAAAVAAVALLDLLVLRRGWCGHLCPVGAFYGWIGRCSRLAVKAVRPEACTRCGDCFAVCPEPQVIVPVLRADADGRACGGTIRSADCLRCGRCLDHCDEDVFELTWGRGADTSPRP